MIKKNLSLLGIFLLLLFFFPLILITSVRKNTGNPIEVPPGILKEGDVIFRQGTSILSRSVNWIDRKAVYTHVGLVTNQDGVFSVIHIVPGEYLEDAKGAIIRVDTIDKYLSEEGVVGISIHRYLPGQQLDVTIRAVAVAESFVRNQVVFDNGFSLETPQEMYCTELIWRAFKAAGVDLVNGVFDRIGAPFGPEEVLYTSSLIRSKYFHEVFSTKIQQEKDDE